MGFRMSKELSQCSLSLVRLDLLLLFFALASDGKFMEALKQEFLTNVSYVSCCFHKSCHIDFPRRQMLTIPRFKGAQTQLIEPQIRINVRATIWLSAQLGQFV